MFLSQWLNYICVEFQSHDVMVEIVMLSSKNMIMGKILRILGFGVPQAGNGNNQSIMILALMSQSMIVKTL